MTKVAAITEARIPEADQVKQILKAQGIDVADLESQIRVAEKELPLLEQRIQSASELTLRPPVGTLALDGSVHSAAKFEIDNFVQVSIELPTPLVGTVWNTNENAIVGVQVLSPFLPLRDIVLELRVNSPISLFPIFPPPNPPQTPNKRYLAKLEPGVRQRFVFLAHAGTNPCQATFEAFLNAEVVPYANRFPAQRVVTVTPA